MYRMRQDIRQQTKFSLEAPIHKTINCHRSRNSVCVKTLHRNIMAEPKKDRGNYPCYRFSTAETKAIRAGE